MENRRRSFVRRRRSGQSAGGFIQALAVFVLFGAAIWLIFGTGAFARLKEKLPGLLPSGCSSGASEPAPTASAEASAAPTPAPTGETVSVTLPGIELWILQEGIYDSAESAAPYAKLAKEAGAAGYVYDDLGSFRLFLAAYPDEASALSVKESLASEGYVCSIFSFSRTGAELAVTAASERLVPIKTAFALSFDIVEQLGELSAGFDSGTESAESAAIVLAEMRTNIENALAGVSAPAKSSAMLAAAADYLGDVSEMIRAASAAAGGTSLSSELKALHIGAALRYAGLLKAIGE